MSNRFYDPGTQYLDNSGNVLSGGLLYFYITGTTTLTSTFSDTTLLTANTNPIVADSAGRVGNIFLDPAVTYSVVLKTSAGTTLWTRDPFTDPAANVTAAFTAFAGNPNGFVAGNAGSVGGSGVSAVYDITNDTLYFCTTTGDAGAAVWTAQTAGSASLSAANTFTNIQTIQITDAGASLAAMLVFDWESATPAANDTAILFKAMGEDSAGNDQDYTRDAFRITDPTSTSEDAERLFGVVTAGTMAYELVLSGAALYPETSDSIALGKTGNLYSDIFLASGAVIDFNAADVVLTHSANALAMTGGTFSVSYSAAGTVMTVESTDAGAGAGPDLLLYRNSASPAISDVLGGILFQGEDSAGNTQTYAAVKALITDPTSTSEEGTLLMQIVKAGTVTNTLSLTGTALYPTTDEGLTLGKSGNEFADVFTTQMQLGHASDTTFARSAAGRVTVEGAEITGHVLLETGSFASAANKDIALDAYPGYSSFELIIHKIVPATDNTSLLIRVSTDSGSTFIATSTYNVGGLFMQGTAAASDSSASSSWIMATQIGNGAAEGASGTFRIYNPESSTYRVMMDARFSAIEAGGGVTTSVNGGFWLGNLQGTGDVTDLRILFSSGNIAAVGSYSLYGIR